jgi:hypothetical protein
MSSPKLVESSVSEFFWLAQERQVVKERREAGMPWPWTADPVLREYRFCNVRREDDRTTVWFRESIRDPLKDDPVAVTLATVVFRWFNRIETGEILKPMLLSGQWDPVWVTNQLHKVKPVVTGAYMIKTPAGMSKVRGICHCVDFFVREGMHQDITHNLGSHTIEGVCDGLMQVPYLGGFMAYEVASDLRWTCVLRDAPDILTWCHLGPGAARGLTWMTGVEYDRNSVADQRQMLSSCQELLEMSRISDTYWPHRWPAWEMREAEHWLCEFDKWKRGTVENQRLKRRYDHGQQRPS